MATHSSILAWEISWTEEPGGLQSGGSQEPDMTYQLNHHHPTMSNSYQLSEIWNEIYERYVLGTLLVLHSPDAAAPLFSETNNQLSYKSQQKNITVWKEFHRQSVQKIKECTEKNENMHVFGNITGNSKNINSRQSDQLNYKCFQSGNIRALDCFFISF